MSDIKQQKRPQDTGFWKVLPFFLVLGGLTVASFLIPLRPVVSYSEKRELAKFPAFSMEALTDGSYFNDITTWFSDTFPGRETWLEAANYINALHGYSSISFSSDFVAADSDSPDSFPDSSAGSTDPTESLPSKSQTSTKDTQPTEPSESQETSSSEPEQDTTEPTEAETVPEETGWGGVNAGNVEIALGAAIQVGDTAFNQLGFSQVQSDRYIKTLSALAAELSEQGVRVISCPAPTSVGIMVEREYLEMLNCAPQDEMLAYLHDRMADNVITVNTYANLVRHNNEYLYFRTDHHWTALGAYYAYEALCQALELEPVPLDQFQELDQGEFRGTLYGKVKWPHKLKQDKVIAYVPPGDITVKAYYNNNARFVEKPLIADVSRRTVHETYLTFLGGDCALMEITNESIPDAPSCVVIKDSYGNCFIPYLTQHYYKVYAIDYREYYEMNLQTFADYFGIRDVIFAPNLTAVQSDIGEGLFHSISFRYTGRRPAPKE